jgi:hypothetical protein
MVQLTMLLSSKNLWMRPAVLEAPAQDPQYLEVIHRVRCCWLGMVAAHMSGAGEGFIGVQLHRRSGLPSDPVVRASGVS